MKTFGWKRFHIRKNERALLLRNGDFERFLTPGRHWVRGWADDLQVQRLPLDQTAFEHPLASWFLDEQPAQAAGHFLVVRLADDEVGLLHEDGLLTAVLAPGARRLYWQAPRALLLQTRSLADGPRIETQLLPRLQQLAQRQGDEALAGVLLAEVPQFHAGLLWVDGQLQEVLSSGLHGFWRHGRSIRVEVVDLRTQLIEISGQEMLSRDKVGLRLNLSAGWHYQDVWQAHARLARPAEHVYRELQFALRAAVGERTLDALLEDKAAIDAGLQARVGPRLAAAGIVLESVGVKDIILPGEMRSILARVVEAEKAAQANLIRRREETAATRSLLNTARVMEDNPVALRMKELETLERVAERIDRISVVGGLDQVLEGLVKLRPR